LSTIGNSSLKVIILWMPLSAGGINVTDMVPSGLVLGRKTLESQGLTGSSWVLDSVLSLESVDSLSMAVESGLDTGNILLHGSPGSTDRVEGIQVSLFLDYGLALPGCGDGKQSKNNDHSLKP